jgi:hypothetical protein
MGITQGMDIPIQTANICQIFFLAYFTKFHYILNYTLIKQTSMEIYVITQVTFFLQQHVKLQLHS